MIKTKLLGKLFSWSSRNSKEFNCVVCLNYKGQWYIGDLTKDFVPTHFVGTKLKMHRTGNNAPDATWAAERSGGAIHVQELKLLGD